MLQLAEDPTGCSISRAGTGTLRMRLKPQKLLGLSAPKATPCSAPRRTSGLHQRQMYHYTGMQGMGRAVRNQGMASRHRQASRLRADPQHTTQLLAPHPTPPACSRIHIDWHTALVSPPLRPQAGSLRSCPFRILNTLATAVLTAIVTILATDLPPSITPLHTVLKRSWYQAPDTRAAA